MSISYELTRASDGSIDIAATCADCDHRVGVSLADSPEIRRNDPHFAEVFDCIKKHLDTLDASLAKHEIDKKLARLAELEGPGGS